MDELLLFKLAPGETLTQGFQSLDELKLTMLFPVNILGRGFTYYYEEWVKNIQIGSESIKATIQGNENYTTQVLQKGNEVYGNCNCPFDGKCKHLAALVIYVMHDMKS
ncbi:MAG: hypothetical protein R2828_15530 [Saprospiraceae bacterium]